MNFSPIIKNRAELMKNTPALRYNSSLKFSEWQKSAREKLIELLGIDDFKICDAELTLVSQSKTDSYEEFVFTVKTEAEYKLTATLRKPVCAEGKLPLAICLFGHSDDVAVSLDGDCDRDLCAQAISRGYCALTIPERSFDNCFAIKDITLEEAPIRATWCACYRSSMRSMMMGRTTIGERTWDTMRTLDAVLAKFGFINEDKIILVGNVGSATTAYYTACIDERIKGTVASCGIGTWESSIAGYSHCVCNYIPRIANFFDMGDVGGLIAPRALVVIASTQDTWFPERGVREAYAQIENCYAASSAPEACRLIMKDTERRFYADDAWGALAEMV